MKTVKIPQIHFARSAAEFPFCFDLVMAHLIAMQGEDWRRAFSVCCHARFRDQANAPENALVFSHFEYEKYRFLGIRIKKVINKQDQMILSVMQEKLRKGIPFVIHFDAFYCPWDKACYQKRHNEHLVIVTGLSRNQRKVCVADVYFKKYHQKLDVKMLLEAGKYYLDISFPEKFRFKEASDYRTELFRFAKILQHFADACQMEGFLKQTTNIPFAEGSYRVLQRARISQFFYRMYLLYLAERGDVEAHVLAKRLEEADQFWVNCLTYIVRGAWNFYYTEQGLSEHIQRLSLFYQHIFDEVKLLENGSETINSSASLDIQKYYNCKMFLRDDECARSDFIEGEKLCVAPDRDISELIVGGRCFRLNPKGDKDNIRTDGQKILCGDVRCRGVSLLCVAECGDIFFSCAFDFVKGERAQKFLMAQDFPEKSKNGINLGDAYIITRWRAFRKVYARTLDVFFDGEKELHSITLPQNSHLHVLALAVLI